MKHVILSIIIPFSFSFKNPCGFVSKAVPSLNLSSLSSPQEYKGTANYAKPKRLEDNVEGVLYVNDKVRT